MKLVKTEDAVGKVLCHDITQIIKDVTKDAVFRKGHIIREEDIPVLLDCGKENVYVLELGEDGGNDVIHEDDAASFLCDLCQGENLYRGNVKEGKIELFAECDGLLKTDEAGVLAVNSAGEMMIASRHGNFPVKKGDKIAGTRIIPLVIEKEKLLAVKDKCKSGPLYKVLPFRHKKAAVIATGSEILKGRIKDTFTPVIEGKLSEYDTEIVYKATPGDDHEKITEEILRAVNSYGADLVLCTGGMSVDPDDRTPLAIRNTGAEVVCYGAPVLPGAMFMLAYYNSSSAGNVSNIPVMGLPGCVMFHGRTIFDLILPRIMADDIVTGAEIAALGTGGMCLGCETCTFPNCGFGK
ncbi:MAG: molybdopterin-binding protein [Lachnospiraceae bacterium]|nr:molybdopterin-binding protein [Lachnospiraceae bacterium]